MALANFSTGGEVVDAVTLSPDGRWLATIVRDAPRVIVEMLTSDPSHAPDRARAETRIWNTNSGHEAARLSCGTLAQSLTLSPDGRRLVLLTALAGPVAIWDVPAQEQIATLDVPYVEAMLDEPAVAFSGDSAQIATSDEWGAAIWSAADGHKLRDVKFEVGLLDWRTAKAVAFSPDGQMLAMASGNLVKVHDLPTRTEVVELPCRESLTMLAYDSQGHRLAAGGGKTVRVWELRSKRAVLECTTQEPLANIAFSRGGRLVTVAATPAVQVLVHAWNTSTRATTLLNHEGRTQGTALSGDGSRLAIVDFDGVLHTWSLDSLRQA
jgi:WD40 repeat protein